MKPTRLAALLAAGALLQFAPSAPIYAAAQDAQVQSEAARLAQLAQRVTIMRDKWGIPHVFGQTDADAVFGMIYAQAEDDFNRVELNYINAMGRLAEVEGEAEIWRDLRMKLFIQPEELKAQYAASPEWLRKLADAFADGMNYYLLTHPEVKPKLITRYEPWMAFSFTEGSIGGDIESVNLKQLEAFYGKAPSPLVAAIEPEMEPRGSNGFAIAPKLSASGRAMLLINPHTSFYFRPEIHMVSEEGMNAYGAVTWGQFFIYQGFNERAGWMHTSGGGDVIDEYLETVVQRNGKHFYKHGDAEREMKAVDITLPYKTDGGMASRIVTAYFTHHGPVVRQADGKWISVSLMNTPRQALTQSYLRTKATSYKAFDEVMQIRTNSSNNTVYADADGNIAYYHGNFVPRRDAKFDWRHPVDGSNPATDWQGLHEVRETITLFNPASGWIQNTNNWPFQAAGANSPKQSDYAQYMWSLPENARGRNAVRVLSQAKNLTLDGLIAAGYDTYLAAFDPLIPALAKDYDALPSGDPLKAQLREQVAMLRAWDKRYSLESVPTTLAIFWGQDMIERATAAARAAELPVVDYISERIGPSDRLQSLARASARLAADFGSWKTPWGEVNRFQRLSGDINLKFDDAKPSIPVPFPSATWGSLASFGMTSRQNTKRIYGERGNSFVAAVEFGPRLRAKSILAGGQSGDPKSPHFTDQAEMYSRGQFKDVLFYKEDIQKNLKRSYHPGE